MRFTTKKFLALTLGTLSMLSFTQCANHSTFEVDYLPVQEEKNGHWGFVGPDGKMIVSDEFKEAPSPVIEGVFTVPEGKDKKLSLYKIGEKPELIKGCDDLLQAGVMQEGLMPVVRKNERIKIIDKKGETRFELGGNGVDIRRCAFRFAEGLLPVMDSEGKWGYVDTKGNLAIKPQYDDVNFFINGHALVETKTKKGDEIYSVIDHDNNVIIELKNGTKSATLYDEYVVYSTGERLRIINMKGEEVLKCKESVKNIEGIHGDNFVFVNDDYEYGVMNMKGEVLVRPKYNGVILLPNGKFVCFDKEDKELYLVNDKDEKLKTIDGEDANFIPGMGLLVESDHDINIYNTDLEKQGKSDFYSVNLSITLTIESDFFDASAVADKILSTFEENMKGITIDASPASIEKLRQAGPESCSYKTEYQWDIVENNQYAIKGDLIFDTMIATSDYDPFTYSSSYKFNNEANLICKAISLKLEQQPDRGGDVAKALIKKLKNQSGNREIIKNEYGALYESNNRLILILGKDSEVGYMEAKSTPELTKAFKALVNSTGETAEAFDNPYAEEADSVVAVEEAVVDEFEPEPDLL